MNILVIGNGFDLAHRLPTKYTDFLDVVESFISITNAPHILKNGGLDNTVKPKYQFLDRLIFEEPFLCNEFREMVQKNFWIEYFRQCDSYEKENWIDFESEISKMIQIVEMEMIDSDGTKYQLSDEMLYLGNEFLAEFFYVYSSAEQVNSANIGKTISFKEIRDRLYKDLNRLIRALEIYLTDFVEKIDVNLKSPDIDDIQFDAVLSFNYTNIYEKLYDPHKSLQYDYIHGVADLSNNIDSNNMVLGIDEHLSEERKNKEVEFIAFKKFYQRIYKETGCRYKEWVDEIKVEYEEYIQRRNDAVNRSMIGSGDGMYALIDSVAAKTVLKKGCNMHHLYIYGHSLDVTDGDILRDLILNDNVYTTIFYFNKDLMGQQIANLVKVIGQEELIKRTGGNTKTIEFRPQQEMVKI